LKDHSWKLWHSFRNDDMESALIDSVSWKNECFTSWYIVFTAWYVELWSL